MSTSSAPAAGAAASSSSASWAGEFRALFALGWPLILAQLAQTALITTDVIMMGWLGPQYLAAGALANALFVGAQLFGVGVVGAVTPMVAQALGAGDLRSVRRTVRQGIWVALLFGLILLPLLWNIDVAYRAMGQDPVLTAMAQHFVRYAVWLIFPSFLIIVFRSFLAAHGSTRIILAITVAGVFVNALCDYALMFGNWGFPRLELAGAGIATTTVNIVMLVLIVAYVLTHRRYRRYHIFHNFLRPDWPRFWEMLRIGLPIGIMLLAEVGLFSSAALLQGLLGEDEVAAHAIALQLASIAFMVPLGLSQATTVRVGIALGEGNPGGVRRAGWTAFAATLLFMSATGLCFFFFPRQLVGLFLDQTNPVNTKALVLAASYLSVAAVFQVVDGTQASMGAALRGLSDTNIPLVIAVVGYWAIGFPVAYVLGFPLGLRGVGIWFGLAAGLASVAVVLTTRFALRDRLGLTRALPV